MAADPFRRNRKKHHLCNSMTMAKPTTLTEMNTGEALYPVTLASLVQTADGGTVDEGLAKAGRALFIYMWKEAAGEYGTYNETTGFFELNGLTDISYKEALEIYSYYPICQSRSDKVYTFAGSVCRTFFPIALGENAHQVNIAYCFSNCSRLETVRIRDVGPAHLLNKVNHVRHAFYNCRVLRTIYGEINLSYMTESEASWPMFARCYSLEDFRLRGLSLNINLGDSPKITLDSLVFMIENRSGVSSVTVTVHADVYAKLTGDTTNAAAAALTEEEAAAWQQLLATAAEKNITFATT